MSRLYYTSVHLLDILTPMCCRYFVKITAGLFKFGLPVCSHSLLRTPTLSYLIIFSPLYTCLIIAVYYNVKLSHCTLLSLYLMSFMSLGCVYMGWFWLSPWLIGSLCDLFLHGSMACLHGWFVIWFVHKTLWHLTHSWMVTLLEKWRSPRVTRKGELS